MVNVRVKARSTPARPVLEKIDADTHNTLTPKAFRPVIFNAAGATPQHTTVYAREELMPGLSFAGPAIVTQYDTTTVLPPGWLAEIDAYGNIIAGMQQ